MSIQQLQHLRAADYPRMPWRNGAGVTAEVACNAGCWTAPYEIST